MMPRGFIRVSLLSRKETESAAFLVIILIRTANGSMLVITSGLKASDCRDAVAKAANFTVICFSKYAVTYIHF